MGLAAPDPAEGILDPGFILAHRPDARSGLSVALEPRGKEESP